MNKKIGGWMFAALFAVFLLGQSQNMATDFGAKDVVNHSNGQIVFPLDKLINSRNVCGFDGGTACDNLYNKTVNYYTTVAAYPTMFVPTVATFDAGCNQIQLREYSPITGQVPNGALFCNIERPNTILDAGVFTIVANADGGYSVSQCPAYTNIGQTAFPAFCFEQLGARP